MLTIKNAENSKQFRQTFRYWWIYQGEQLTMNSKHIQAYGSRFMEFHVVVVFFIFFFFRTGIFVRLFLFSSSNSSWCTILHMNRQRAVDRCESLNLAKDFSLNILSEVWSHNCILHHIRWRVYYFVLSFNRDWIHFHYSFRAFDVPLLIEIAFKISHANHLNQTIPIQFKPKPKPVALNLYLRAMLVKIISINWNYQFEFVLNAINQNSHIFRRFTSPFYSHRRSFFFVTSKVVK